MSRSRKRPAWTTATSKSLVAYRICDLGVTLDGTWVERAVEKTLGELTSRGLALRPHYWLAHEWLTPDGMAGFALPFYLAHPRLIRLERQQMLEAEGATLGACLKLLRHELGHVVQNAYRVHRRRRYQQLFGRSTTPYPGSYRPNPASTRFVQHLEGWYAQSHPAEDFAETFAVWLTPRSYWKQRYRGWHALEKLRYLDELMQQLRGVKPAVRSRARPFSVASNRMTLREHYQRKREHYAVGYTDAYDNDLRRLFREDGGREPAAKFLRRCRREILETVSRCTGHYAFAVDLLMKEMIGRCRELELRTDGRARDKWEFAILLTMHSMTYVYRRREWHAV